VSLHRSRLRVALRSLHDHSSKCVEEVAKDLKRQGAEAALVRLLEAQRDKKRDVEEQVLRHHGVRLFKPMIRALASYYGKLMHLGVKVIAFMDGFVVPACKKRTVAARRAYVTWNGPSLARSLPPPAACRHSLWC
jgi:hypothetical protein